MRIKLTQYACTLTREAGDKKLYTERAVSFAMKTLLEQAGIDARRVRGAQGLTSCLTASMLRLVHKPTESMLWHDRYAIEFSYEAFNAGSVTFSRAW